MSSVSTCLMDSRKWVRLMKAQGWRIETVDVPRADGALFPTPCMVKGGKAVPIPNGAVSRAMIGFLKMKHRPRRR